MMTYIEKLKVIEDEKKLKKYFELYQIPVKEACIDFINNFVYTYDPRLEDKIIPFHLYEKQEKYISWLFDRYKNREHGAVDKCRDVGATWLTIAFAIYFILFQKNISIGLYTFKADECDNKKDVSTLMGKVRFIIERLPTQWTNGIEISFMYLKNEMTNSDIVGASGDNPGRGGRRTMFIKDECAFYSHAEMIEAALSETSDCQIDISTHAGTNTLFYNKVNSGMPVFEFDWWDVPTHTQKWYEDKKKRAETEGLLHVFKREIERNPAASIEKVLIPSEWVLSATRNIDKISGKRIAALDVADEGRDTNALVIIDGNTLVYVDEWSDGDTGETAVKAYYKAIEYECDELRYDCIGVGAGVKAAINRIREKEESEENKKMRIIGWSAAGQVIRINETDYNDRQNKRMFKNAKSQAYWKVRDEFYNTYKKINNCEYDKDKTITFDIDNLLVKKLIRELSQPQHKLNEPGQIIIDKKPAGSKSPNLCEAYVMARAEVEEEWVSWSVVA